MKNRHKLTEKRYVVPFVLITTLFFLWGFARAILDVLNKHFQDELHISITQSSLIQVTTYLGYFLMAIPAGMFITRYGYRRGVVFGLALFGLGALAFIPGNTFAAFLAALFVIGCGLTFLETAANPYVTELGDKETASSRLNLSQTFNGMGCFMATLLVGSFLFSDEKGGADVSVPYAIMGGMVLLIALVFTKVELPEVRGEECEVREYQPSTSHTSHLLPLTSLFHDRWFVFGLLALLSYEVAEISINSYFVNFVTGTGWMSKLDASRFVSLALVIFMVGRFLGSWIMRRIEAERMLFYCAVGTVACMVLTMLNLGTVSLVALIANYLFEAIMFPTIFSLSVQGLGNKKKSASSLLMMTPIGGCGFLLMGWMADHTNPFLPFVIPLAGFAVVLAYAFVSSRERAKAKSM
ncbi:MAG: sugar MFS transporter [Prevotella sp.]|nr:sugar MFS transporter [Prevotella sp.]